MRMASDSPSTNPSPNAMPSLDSLNNVRNPSSTKSKYECHLPRAMGYSMSNHADIPPSVAALLEATTIPLPRKRARAERTRNTVQGRVCGAGRTAEAEQSRRPRLDALFKVGSEKTATSDGISERSESSTLSLPGSVPSLENDDDLSMTTAFSDPPTPGSTSSRTPFEKKHKLVSQSEPCESDPLLLSDDFAFSEDPELSRTETLASTNSSPFRPFPKLRATFKYNLSSSLRALKSAAQTVSNFTSPSIWVNDTPSQPILSISPGLTDDKRPNLANEMPSLALRRYLNPSSAHTHTSSIHSYYKSSRGRYKPLPCVSSIQMQTYNESPPDVDITDTVTNTDTNNELRSNGDEPLNPALRHREVRENSDFLRMFVLELNMRRVGKLQSNCPGKAQIWLPPRRGESPVSRICSSEAAVGTSSLSGAISLSVHSSAPPRWVSLTAD